MATSSAQHNALADALAAVDPAGAELTRVDGAYSVLKRLGALPGAVNYYGGSLNSPDEYVRAPLTVQWSARVLCATPLCEPRTRLISTT